MVVVSIPYGDYVMSAEDAFALLKIHEKAERFQEKWRTGGGGYTYHVYPNDGKMTMHTIPDDMYRVAKLAGKPEEK